MLLAGLVVFAYWSPLDSLTQRAEQLRRILAVPSAALSCESCQHDFEATAHDCKEHTPLPRPSAPPMTACHSAASLASSAPFGSFDFFTRFDLPCDANASLMEKPSQRRVCVA